MDKLITHLNLTPSTEAKKSSGNGSGNNPPPSSSLMAKLWERMIEMYGHKFTSSYGEVPSETWSRALSGATSHDLAEGVKACFKREDSWPPSLPEFVEMCRPRMRALYFPDAMKSLPPPRPSKEKALAELAKIREKL